MRKVALGMVLASMLAGGAAQAAMTASAELNGLKLTLVDLDTHDGITPSVTWIEPDSWPNTSKVDLQIGDSNADWTFHSWTEGPPVSAITYQYTILRGTSAGTTTNDGSNLQMRSQVEFWGADGAWNKVGNTTTTGNLSFVLTPNTALTLSSDVVLSASPTNLPFVLSALTSASATLYVDGAWVRQANFNSAQYGGATSLTKTLSYTLSNLTNASTDHRVYIGLSSNVSANFSIAAVPEPSTWGMLVLGAAMVGGLARRRSVAPDRA